MSEEILGIGLQKGLHTFRFDRMKETETLLDKENYGENLVPILSNLAKLEPKELEKLKPKIEEFVRRIIETEKLKSDSQFEDLDDNLRTLWHLSELSNYINKELLVEIWTKMAEIEEYIKDQTKNDPTLIDDYLFGIILSNTNDIMRRGMEEIEKHPEVQREIKKVFDVLALANKKVQIKDNTCFIEQNGEIWEFKFIRGGDFVSVVSKQNPNIFSALRFDTLIENLEKDKFDEIVREAKENYKTEQEKRETLAKFDLPADKPISYLRIFPQLYDDTISSNLFSSMVMESILQARYPNITTSLTVQSENPKVEIMEDIKEGYKEGIRVFYLDIYSHGTEKEIQFTDKSLNANDLVEIASEFPDAQFIISTIACYGGGLREDFLKIFEKHPELKNKFSIFLQTKPKNINLTGKKMNGNKIGKIYSTDYWHFFMAALRDGKKFGEAVNIADEEAKNHDYLDAESIIHGELFTELPPEISNEEKAA